MKTILHRGTDSHIELLIAAHALDALDDVERAAVERHLRDCGHCAAEASAFAEATARLGAAEAVPPPPGLRSRVLEAARTTPQVSARRPSPRHARSRLPRLTTFAAALFLVAGAVGVTWQVQQNRIDRERTRVQAIQDESSRIRSVLTAPDARMRTSAPLPAGRISVVYSPSLAAAVLSLDGLSPQPTSKTYQMWRITHGVATSLGALKPGQTADSVIAESLTATDRLAVSVENAGGSTTPHGTYAAVNLG